MRKGDLVQNDYYVVIVTKMSQHAHAFQGVVLRIDKNFHYQDHGYKYGHEAPQKGDIRNFDNRMFKPLKRGTIIKP